MNNTWENLWSSYCTAMTRLDIAKAKASVATEGERCKARQQVAFADGKVRAAARRLYDFDHARDPGEANRFAKAVGY